MRRMTGWLIYGAGLIRLRGQRWPRMLCEGASAEQGSYLLSEPIVAVMANESATSDQRWRKYEERGSVKLLDNER